MKRTLREEIKSGRAFKYYHKWYKFGPNHLWVWVNRKGWRLVE